MLEVEEDEMTAEIRALARRKWVNCAWIDKIECCCCSICVFACMLSNAMFAQGFVKGRGDAEKFVPTAACSDGMHEADNPLRPDDIIGVFMGVTEET